MDWFVGNAPGAESDSEAAQTWLDAVLAGKGEKDGRPNNCMSEEWPASGSLPDFMRPGLQRGPRDARGDTWVERS